jgi:hypothetical protein
MKKWSILPVIVAITVIMPVFSSGVAAQSITAYNSGPLSQELSLPSDNLHSSAGYTMSDNGTMTRGEILKQEGVPGKGIDNATGLRKFFNSISQAMERIRNKFRRRVQEQNMPQPGFGNSDNVTVTDNTTMNKAEILKERGVPGKGIEEAPGLQKPFNPNSNAADKMQNRNQEKVKEKNKEQSGNSDNVTMNKADVLIESGVPGQGVNTAPGLQKKYNPKSNASDNAGKNK